MDFGDYLVSVDKGRLGAKIGHHQAAPQSLVIRGFSRRGASMSYAAKDDRLKATGFAFRAQPITGFRHGLGVGNKEDRVSGAVVSARPFSSAATEVSLTWLTGQRTEDSGIGIVDEEETSSGDAVSVAVASKLADGKVELRGEVAQSDFDFDGENTGLDTVRDDAYSLSAVIRPIKSQSGEKNLEIGIEHKNIGSLFKSLANQGLPTDVNSSRINSRYSQGGFSVVAALERQENNTADNALLPTIQTNIRSLGLNFASRQKNEELGWYGRPNLSLSWQQADQRVVNESSLLPLQLDSANNQININLGFRYPTWDWRLGYSMGSQDDETGQRSNTENRMLNLGLNLRAGKRFFFGVLAQSGENEELATGQITENQLFSLNGTAVIIPRKLQANMNLSRSDQIAVNSDVSVTSVNGGLTWTVRPGSATRTGLSLWLKGSWQDVEDVKNPTDERYQVFLGLSLNFGQ